MENEKDAWVPTPEQLRMIDEGLASLDAGRIFTGEEAKAEIRRRIAAIDSALNTEESA